MAKPAPKKKTPRPVTPYEPKGYELKQIFQLIKSQDLFENLDFDPKYLPLLFTSNLIGRVMARCIAQGPTGPVAIKATNDGTLFTVSRGGAFSRYLVLTGTGDDAGATIDLGQQVSRVDIFTYDNPAIYKLSRDMVVPVGDSIELFKDSFYSLDVYTRRIYVINKTAMANCRYTFIGWYD